MDKGSLVAPRKYDEPIEKSLPMSKRTSAEMNDNKVSTQPKHHKKQRRQETVPGSERHLVDSTLLKCPSVHKVFQQIEEETKRNPNLNQKRKPKPTVRFATAEFVVDDK